MRNFLADLSHLLQAADRMMGESGWEPKDSNCLDGLSYSVSTGAKWMPGVASRTYRNASDFPGIAIMIAIILMDDIEYKYELLEPVVAASVFKVADDFRIYGWQAHFFGWNKVSSDGKPLTMKKKDEPDWKSSWGWSELTMLGRPLVEITNEGQLAELVIQPVLKLINKRA